MLHHLLLASCLMQLAWGWGSDADQDFSESEKRTIQQASLVSASLSFCGSAFIVSCVTYFRKWGLVQFKVSGAAAKAPSVIFVSFRW